MFFGAGDEGEVVGGRKIRGKRKKVKGKSWCEKD